MSRSSDAASTSRRVTLKGEVIAEIIAGNPGGKLKSVEYGSFGNITKVEWYEPDADDDDGLSVISDFLPEKL